MTVDEVLKQLGICYDVYSVPGFYYIFTYVGEEEYRLSLRYRDESLGSYFPMLWEEVSEERLYWLGSDGSKKGLREKEIVSFIYEGFSFDGREDIRPLLEGLLADDIQKVSFTKGMVRVKDSVGNYWELGINEEGNCKSIKAEDLVWRCMWVEIGFQEILKHI